MRGRVLSAGDTPASTGNIANIVTIVRILMVPAFVWLLLADAGQLGPMRYIAAVLFIVAIVTDSVDGSLARSRNLITDFGKILDPIADKLLIGSALVCLSILGELWWWVTALILVREFGITLYRMVALRKRVIPASSGGKLKTIFQAVAISFYLVPTWLLLGGWMHWVNAALMAIAVALTLWSGIQYLVAAYRFKAVDDAAPGSTASDG